MNSLPREKVPSAMNPEGVAQFNSQLAYQNPKQDGEPNLCKHLTKEQEVSLKCLYMTLLEARGTGFIKISDNNTNVSYPYSESSCTTPTQPNPRHSFSSR